MIERVSGVKNCIKLHLNDFCLLLASFNRSQRDGRARSGTIPVCGAFVGMQTGREFAKASGGVVVASLLGAIICLTTTGALAEGPLKFPSSQLEPTKWS